MTKRKSETVGRRPHSILRCEKMRVLPFLGLFACTDATEPKTATAVHDRLAVAVDQLNVALVRC